MLVVLGDVTAVDSRRADGAVVLAEAGASLGEVAAAQIPRLAAYPAAEVDVFPGPADLLAGHDESRIHAELVAVCDALLRVAAPESIVFHAFAPVPGRQHDGRLIDAAARVTCKLRGIAWHGPARAAASR